MDFLQPTSWQEALDAAGRAPRRRCPSPAAPTSWSTSTSTAAGPVRCSTSAGWPSCGSGATDDGADPARRRRPYTRIIDDLGAQLPGLAMASRTVGSPQIRIRGTVGGNLGSASPAGDAHPPLLAAGAVVEVESAARGTRLIPVAEFYTGVKRNALEPDELIAAVLVPTAAGPQQFCKVGTRNAMVIAVSRVRLRAAPRPPGRGHRHRLGRAHPAPGPGRRGSSSPASSRPPASGTPAASCPTRLAARVRRARRRRGLTHRRRPGQRRLPAALAGGDGAARRHLGLERPTGRRPDACASPPPSTAPSTQVDDVWAGESLLYVLRERMGLPGSKNACEQGECGSCTVYLDGEPVCACLVAAGQAIGREVTTVEGLADGERLHPVQEAFVECGAVQCGFCTPGLVVAAHDLLARVPPPSDLEIREALAGNLCRCTGYEKILDAVRLAAERQAAVMSDRRRAPATTDATTTVTGTGPDRGQPAAPRRHAQGHRRVRLRQRPVARRDVLGRDPAQPAPARPDPRHRHHRGAHRAGRLGGAHRRRRPGRERLRPGARRPAGARLGVRALRGRAGRAGRRRPPGDRPPGGRSGSRSTTRCCPPSPTPRRAMDADAPAVHRPGNLVRHLQLRRGEEDPTAPVVVSLDFEVGMQDQAFLGPESGLAVPAEDGGVDLYVATQWLHVDQRQICLALGMPPEKVRLHAVRRRRRVRRPRGPVGARARLPAGAAHRQAGEDELQPRGVVLRPRAPAPGDDALRVRRRDATARSSTPRPTCSSTAARTPRPPPPSSATPAPWAWARTASRTVAVDAYGVFTNNPPCGAMRGFGCVQAALRLRGADGRAGRRRRAGPGGDPAAQRHARGRPQHHRPGHRLRRARRASCCRSCADMPLPPPAGHLATSASCPGRSATPPTARASSAASATR